MVVNRQFPFNAQSPGYAPLQRAPLVSVLAQVRFPVQSAFVSDPDGLARRISAELATTYPLFEEGHEVSMTILPDGTLQQNPSTSRLWRLASIDSTWRVSFGQGFLSLETTTAYQRRSDFSSRFSAAWEAFCKFARPAFILRLGTRYINRLDDPRHLAILDKLIRPEVLGALHSGNNLAEVTSGISEVVYDHTDRSSLHARWGLLPQGAAIDPTQPPAPARSWILDCDASRTWGPNEQLSEDLLSQVDGLALHAYEFFRWAVTPEFISTFGGEQ